MHLVKSGNSSSGSGKQIGETYPSIFAAFSSCNRNMRHRKRKIDWKIICPLYFKVHLYHGNIIVPYSGLVLWMGDHFGEFVGLAFPRTGRKISLSQGNFLSHPCLTGVSIGAFRSVISLFSSLLTHHAPPYVATDIIIILNALSLSKQTLLHKLSIRPLNPIVFYSIINGVGVKWSPKREQLSL